MYPYLEIQPRCISCDTCRLICPENAILKNGQVYTINTHNCTLCGNCVQLCPVDAIIKKEDSSD